MNLTTLILHTRLTSHTIRITPVTDPTRIGDEENLANLSKDGLAELSHFITYSDLESVSHWLDCQLTFIFSHFSTPDLRNSHIRLRWQSQ